MICPYCGTEITSEKIFAIHIKKCDQKQEQKQEKVDIDRMNWREFLKYASKQGINVKNKKKQEILRELKVGD